MGSRLAETTEFYNRFARGPEKDFPRAQFSWLISVLMTQARLRLEQRLLKSKDGIGNWNLEDIRFGVDYIGNLRRILICVVVNAVVSIAALLRRYLPSPHSLLGLLSHVPALDYYLNHVLCHTRDVNFTRLYSGGPSRPFIR